MSKNAESSYRQVRILLYPNKTGPGFSWALTFVKQQGNVPVIGLARHGVVGGHTDDSEWGAFQAAVKYAADAAYLGTPLT